MADPVGINKGMYKKGATTAEDTTGNWTTGNAGSKYSENQWAFYQYQIDGLVTGTVPPDYDIFWDFSVGSSIFVDAIANLRACIDCTMLDGTHPVTPEATTTWVLAKNAVTNINHVMSSASASSTDPATIDWTGSSGFCSPMTENSLSGWSSTHTPAAFHCMKITGSALKALFNGMGAGGANPLDIGTGTHSVTLYYAAHLAASYTWLAKKEDQIGACASLNYAAPLTSAAGLSFEPTAPSDPTCGAHSDGIPIYGADVYTGWTYASNGAGSAPGSSSQFKLSASGIGQKALPIPSVAVASNTVIITKQMAAGAWTNFGFTSTSSDFTLTQAVPSITFNYIPPGGDNRGNGKQHAGLGADEPHVYLRDGSDHHAKLVYADREYCHRRWDHGADDYLYLCQHPAGLSQHHQDRGGRKRDLRLQQAPRVELRFPARLTSPLRAGQVASPIALLPARLTPFRKVRCPAGLSPA